MTTLPRFRAGHLGPLDHNGMNAVMEATERVLSRAKKAPSGTPPEPKAIIGKLGDKVTTPTWKVGYAVYKWKQVQGIRPEPGAPWEVGDVSNGMNEGWSSPPEYAVSFGGATTGDLVEMLRLPVAHGDAGAQGGVWWAAVPLSVETRVASGRVVDRLTSIGMLGVPGYAVQTFVAAGDWFNPGGVIVNAINAFEVASGVQNQVVSLSPGTKTIKPIPNGDPVGPMQKLPFGSGDAQNPDLWLFTFPNAYQVVC